MAVTQRRLAKASSEEDQCPRGLGGRLLDMEISGTQEHQDTEAEWDSVQDICHSPKGNVSSRRVSGRCANLASQAHVIASGDVSIS